MLEQSEKELLEKEIKRIITRLFKDYLGIINDLKDEHLEVISTISNQFPPELIDKLSLFTLPKYSRIRKKILDSSNDSIREINTLISQYSNILR